MNSAYAATVAWPGLSAMFLVGGVLKFNCLSLTSVWHYSSRNIDRCHIFHHFVKKLVFQTTIIPYELFDKIMIPSIRGDFWRPNFPPESQCRPRSEDAPKDDNNRVRQTEDGLARARSPRFSDLHAPSAVIFGQEFPDLIITYIFW